jgi:hypothetical protein
MKKASVFLSLLAVLGSGCLAANATVLSRTAASLKAYFPDEQAFRDGQSDAYYFLSDAAANNGGKGSANYNSVVDAETQSALQNENAATRGTDEHYYWWGYRITLQNRR